MVRSAAIAAAATALPYADEDGRDFAGHARAIKELAGRGHVPTRAAICNRDDRGVREIAPPPPP
jgi:hypothetical protein